MKARILLSLILTLLVLRFSMGSGTANVSAPEFARSTAPNNNLNVQNALWYIETIQPGTKLDSGANASIAYTADDIPYISYYDAQGGNLMLANLVGSGGNCDPYRHWLCRVIEKDGDVGRYSSIAIRGPGNAMQVHIAYYDDTKKALKYARGICSPACKWTITTIDDPASPGEAGRYAALKLDSTGNPHIAYNVGRSSIHPVGNQSSLRYASYVGAGGDCGQSQWTCETIDGALIVSNFGMHASLDFNGQDAPRIAYFDTYEGRLFLAVYQGEYGTACPYASQWNCYPIDDVYSAGFQSLFISKTLPEKQGIAYYDQYNHLLKFASLQQTGGNCGPVVQGGQVWECDVIDKIGATLPGAGIAVAGDREGFPILGYISRADDLSPAQLKIARPIEAMGLDNGNCGPKDAVINAWQCGIIDPDIAGSGNTPEAVNITIGVNRTEFASMAYQAINADQAGDLRFAEQRLTYWVPLVRKP